MGGQVCTTGSRTCLPRLSLPSADTLRPQDDLSIHARKITDVEKWLTESFTLTSSDPNPKLAKYRRVLVLSGPAGAGKTATVKALANEMGAEIVEWKEGTNVDYANDDGAFYSLVISQCGPADVLKA